MSCGMMDLTPLLYAVRVLERSLPFLIRGLLVTISVISEISPVSHVDFPIILLLHRGPHAMGLKKSSLGFRSLNAYVGDYKEISHHLGLLYGDLLHSLDIIDPIAEGIDDLDVLDVRYGIPGIAEMLHVVM
jgi:hypothetical protein